MITYVVTWKKKGYALPFLIDFSEETLAIKAGVALNEVGRYDVAITSVEYDDDPEMAQRIWARVQARISSPPEVFA